jgi:hypothetical protein
MHECRPSEGGRAGQGEDVVTKAELIIAIAEKAGLKPDQAKIALTPSRPASAKP